QVGAAEREQHLGLEDEAIADDADVRPVAQYRAQSAEELRAVARQLLDLAGERGVEALAEIGDLHLLVLALGLRRVERGGNLLQLLAQRQDLLVELVDRALRLRQLGLALGGVLLGGGGVTVGLRRGVVGAGEAIGQLVARLGRRLELARELRQVKLEVLVLPLRQRELVGDNVKLRREVAQRLVAPRERIGEVELDRREHQQQKDDHHHELRQRVDEARPDVDAGAALAAGGERHGGSLPALHVERCGSSASAAMVRARRRISLRISCTASPRPWLISSLIRARYVSMLRRWTCASCPRPLPPVASARRASTGFSSTCCSARRSSSVCSVRIWSVRVPRRSVKARRLLLAEMRLSSPRPRMRCRFSRPSAV